MTLHVQVYFSMIEFDLDDQALLCKSDQTMMKIWQNTRTTGTSAAYLVERVQSDGKEDKHVGLRDDRLDHSIRLTMLCQQHQQTD